MYRWAQGIGGKRILWCASSVTNESTEGRLATRIEQETKQCHAYSRTSVDLVSDEDGEPEAVRRAVTMLNEKHPRYDLVISQYGQSLALNLLRAMRSPKVDASRACPLIVFAAGVATDLQARKRETMALGAVKYCYATETLLQEIYNVLAPVEDSRRPCEI